MNKEETLRLLEEHLDHRANEPLPRELQTSLERDPELGREWKELKLVDQALKENSPTEPSTPCNLHERIMTRVRNVEDPITVARPKSSRSYWFVPVGAVAAALLLLLLLPPRRDPETTAPPTPPEKAVLALPDMNISEELMKPRQAIRQKGENMIDSAGRFFLSAARTLPDLPADDTVEKSS